MQIIPKELRVIVYNVVDQQIINSKQRQNHLSFVQAEPTLVRNKKKECLTEMDNAGNFWSFVYVHHNGLIETEVNVKTPKYQFHADYNSEAVPAFL